MVLREDERDRCDGDVAPIRCAEYYECSLCGGRVKVSDGYEDWPCRACESTGCGYASVCNCTQEMVVGKIVGQRVELDWGAISGACSRIACQAERNKSRESAMEIRYRATVENDLMQIVDGEEVGTLGVRLSPDTADLFARAPDMAAEIASLRAQLAAAQTECERLRGLLDNEECDAVFWRSSPYSFSSPPPYCPEHLRKVRAENRGA